MLYPLNLPEFEFAYRKVGETRMIFDPIRRRFVKLTPEEWVRQNFVQFLVQDRAYPRSLIGIEKGFAFRGKPRRADVAAHDRNGRCVLLAECKAPDVAVSQKAFDQISLYNQALGARYLVVTNGVVHYCCRTELASGTCTFVDAIPHFEQAIDVDDIS